MADIFISYSKKHAALTEELARHLEASGYTTWWDTSLLPDDVFFPQTIRDEIKAAKAVIVIWAEHSVISRWVHSEATEGDEQGKLLQVRDEALDTRLVPLPFKSGNISLVNDRAKVFTALQSRGIVPSKAGKPEPKRFLEFHIACDADKGSRSSQEDAFKVWRPHGPSSGDAAPVLAVLAAGIGGEAVGANASLIATDFYVEKFKSGFSSIGATRGALVQLLDHALTASNQAIGAEINRNTDLAGMGCTLIAAYLASEGLCWSSVGNCSLLLYRDKMLIRLNEDHSVGALLDRQAEANLISFEAAKNDPLRQTLRSALSGGPIPLQETVSEPELLCHGDWVIIASDGLETLRGNEIARIVERYREFGQAKDAVRDLLTAIKMRAVPNQDNVSIIVIKIEDPHEASTDVISARGSAR
jgi:serine/threonine protein phosphatase PrpC